MESPGHAASCPDSRYAATSFVGHQEQQPAPRLNYIWTHIGPFGFSPWGPGGSSEQMFPYWGSLRDSRGGFCCHPEEGTKVLHQQWLSPRSPSLLLCEPSLFDAISSPYPSWWGSSSRVVSPTWPWWGSDPPLTPAGSPDRPDLDTMGSGTSAAHGRIWFLAEHVDRGSPTVGPRAEEGSKD